MPRCTTTACCRSRVWQAGVHAGDEHRRSRRRIRLRLAHHRRDAVAFRRNDRLPQRDRALPARHLTVVVLTNRNEPEPYAMAKKIAALYLDSAHRNVERHARRRLGLQREVPPLHRIVAKPAALPSHRAGDGDSRAARRWPSSNRCSQACRRSRTACPCRAACTHTPVSSHRIRSRSTSRRGCGPTSARCNRRAARACRTCG